MFAHQITLCMIYLYLARHGETQENVAQILQGHMPGHLTPQGREQAANLRDQLVKSGIHFDVLLYSDLQRTHDTATIINQQLRVACVKPCPLLRERYWGSFAGTSIVAARSLPIPPDAESVEQLFKRAQRFLIYIKEFFDGKTILAIGHGLFNRTILAAYNNKSIRDIQRMQNAEVRLLAFDKLPSAWTSSTSDIISAN